MCDKRCVERAHESGNFAINGSGTLGMILVRLVNHGAARLRDVVVEHEEYHSVRLKVDTRRKRERAGWGERWVSTVGTISHFIVVIENHN